MDKTPSMQLRALFVQHGVTPVRRAVADAGFLTTDLVAVAGSDAAAAAARLQQHVKESLPTDDNARDIELLKLGAVWNTASTMAVANATAQCRVIDDLSKIPVIPTTNGSSCAMPGDANIQNWTCTRRANRTLASSIAYAETGPYMAVWPITD